MQVHWLHAWPARAVLLAGAVGDGWWGFNFAKLFLARSREILLFVYIELCGPAALPGSPAFCRNIGAAGNLHGGRHLGSETRITPAPWLLQIWKKTWFMQVKICRSQEKMSSLNKLKNIECKIILEVNKNRICPDIILKNALFRLNKSWN